MLMFIIETVVGGVALAGVLAFIRWLYKSDQARRKHRAGELVAKQAECQRLAQRQKTRFFSPVGIRIPGADAWGGTTASGYGSVVRDDLRRKGLTPADYARGTTRQRPK